ncbi:Transcription factor TGA1 [Linum perenne]
MNSSPTQFVTSGGGMEMYEHVHQLSMWGENFMKSNGSPNALTSILIPNTSPSLFIAAEMKMDNQITSDDTSHGTPGVLINYEQEVTKSIDKVQRRLAQNREAARKSRIRKKAYVKQLESSRLKLIQLEQELDKARQQGSYVDSAVEGSHTGFNKAINSGIATFEMEYVHWLEEQQRHVSELRTALNSGAGDGDIHVLVDASLNHYYELFRMKAVASKADVFYIMYGLWKSSAERFFLWIGGFRPSELIKILRPQIEPLAEPQLQNICNLGQLCQQAEDALSQGMERLQQTLAQSVADGQLGEASYSPQIDTAMEKLDSLVRFVRQADHLRKVALVQVSQILTTRQAARGLLALGEYFDRLRALSQVWETNNVVSESPS